VTIENTQAETDIETDIETQTETEAENRALAELLDQLSLAEKVQLLSGRDFWTTVPIEKIGLRRMLLSDGPSGVRGETWDERDPSLNLPSASALASSWDTALARRYGAAAAFEARRKGVDIILGPTINLHRSPLGGRHFEAFSEDPVLTADLAAAYVIGVQENGVAATPKHYIANDSETDRFTVDVQVDERTLREVYLRAFERAIVESHAWLVMSSYNSINGTTATENELLETPLNTEWGFDGVVVSDWTAVRSVESARHSQDLVMPGPHGAWGDALLAAVEAGSVDKAAIDRKVLRLLRLASRVGALDGFEGTPLVEDSREDGVAFVREAAAAGTVLLTNRGELPWNPQTLRSLAVIGHNARNARTQGGGSATVVPESVVSPLDGVRAALPNTRVTYAVGAVVQRGVAEIPPAQLTNPVTGGPGVRVDFVDAAGKELYSEDRRSSSLIWFGGTAPIAASSSLRLATNFVPDATGTVRLGFAATGHGRISADGAVILDATVEAEGTDLGAALLAPASASAALDVTAGTPVELRIEYDLGERTGALADALGFTFGIEPDDDDPSGLIAAAVEQARHSDAALVVVGTNSKVESEGFDRTSLALPGYQDDLVRAVAAVNRHTVVVVNAGAPVLMPWRESVAAVLVGYFGGQEFGNAIADVLTGKVEPGGRLPTTWPAEESDAPVLNTTPEDGVLRYDEGIHIGYRAWLKAGAIPAFGFGHGLGYTTFRVADARLLTAAAEESVVTLSVEVTNTGSRDGKAVVQVYAERPDSVIDRPERWLVGFGCAVVGVGEYKNVQIEIPTRLLAHWDDGWKYEPGIFRLRVGTSLDSLPLDIPIYLVS
jgi:beta-glucosidase